MSAILDLFPACELVGVSSATREAWLEARRGLLTASDMAAVLGKDPYKSSLDVWVEKVHGPEDEPLTIESPAFWGINLEQYIARIVSMYYEWEYVEGGDLLRSKEHPILGCTLDGLAKPPGEARWGLYEGKTTGVFLAKDWDVENDMPPLRVLIQVQHQLGVTGAPYAMVFCLIGGNTPRLIRIEPHAEFQSGLRQTAAEFMDLVQRRIQPAPDHRSKSALDRLHPEEMAGKVVDLPGIALEWVTEIQLIGEKMKVLHDRQEHLKNLLRATLGDAQYGRLPHVVGGKGACKWATIKRSAYSVEASSYRQLQLVKALPKELAMLPAPMALPPQLPDAGAATSHG